MIHFHFQCKFDRSIKVIKLNCYRFKPFFTEEKLSYKINFKSTNKFFIETRLYASKIVFGIFLKQYSIDRPVHQLSNMKSNSIVTENLRDKCVRYEARTNWVGFTRHHV